MSSFLSPICRDSLSGIQEGFSFFRWSTHLFNFGQKRYVIRYLDHKTTIVEEIKGRVSWIGVLLRVVAIASVAIAVFVYLISYLYRSINKFEVMNEQEQIDKILVSSFCNIKTLSITSKFKPLTLFVESFSKLSRKKRIDLFEKVIDEANSMHAVDKTFLLLSFAHALASIEPSRSLDVLEHAIRESHHIENPLYSSKIFSLIAQELASADQNRAIYYLKLAIKQIKFVGDCIIHEKVADIVKVLPLLNEEMSHEAYGQLREMVDVIENRIDLAMALSWCVGLSVFPKATDDSELFITLLRDGCEQQKLKGITTCAHAMGQVSIPKAKEILTLLIKEIGSLERQNQSDAIVHIAKDLPPYLLNDMAQDLIRRANFIDDMQAKSYTLFSLMNNFYNQGLWEHISAQTEIKIEPYQSQAAIVFAKTLISKDPHRALDLIESYISMDYDNTYHKFIVFIDAAKAITQLNRQRARTIFGLAIKMAIMDKTLDRIEVIQAISNVLPLFSDSKSKDLANLNLELVLTVEGKQMRNESFALIAQGFAFLDLKIALDFAEKIDDPLKKAMTLIKIADVL